MHPLLKQHQHTLLGRLRTKIFARVAGTEERLPTSRELWRAQMDLWKQNPIAGRIEFHIMHTTEVRQVPYPAKLSRQQVRATLRHLANHEAPLSLYVEGKEACIEGSQKVGCLLLGHERPCGGPGYYAAILTEEAFPSCGYVSIVPSAEAGQSIISVLNADGWHDLTSTQAGAQDSTRIALTALNEVPDSEGRIIMPLDKITVDPIDDPPHDPECARRLNLVMRGRMPLTTATIPTSSVRLFAESFSGTLRKAIVQQLAHDLASNRKELLVYWDGSHFISSDDYYLFGAYRLLSVRELPVVIMGEFPEKIACIGRQGGCGLLPPLLIRRNKVMPGKTEEFLAWQAEEEIAQVKRLPAPYDLMASWIVFADLLGDDDANERTLHDFLDKTPILMGAAWDEVQSEVSFGGQYRADLVLRANRALPTVCLVELEKSSHRLFTKDLHETDEVTHAFQQVSDWLRWWRENSNDSIVAPSRGVDPTGLVVIGRSTRLNDEERQVLAHNNQRRQIKVITYDELLDDLGTLILHRLDETRL